MTTAHREPYQITGYTAQQAAAGNATFGNTSSYQAHGNPGPHDKRAGYLNPGEPGGIDPFIPSETGASTQVKDGLGGTAKNPKGDVQANPVSPVLKHGWTSQSP